MEDPSIEHMVAVPTRFLGHIVCDKLSKASKARGKLLEPGEDAAFTGIWTLYFAYMVANIKIVNDDIAEAVVLKSGPAKALGSLMLLFCCDIYFQSAVWGMHLDGFLAYLHHHGGVAAALSYKPKPLPYLHHVLG